MEQIENKIKQLMDNQNKPFKHLRPKYDSKLLNTIKSCLEAEFNDVDVNQITINKNNRLGKHKHSNQSTLSYGYLFGDFTGGNLMIENKEISVRNKWFTFNGTLEHYVKEFTGDRYSIIAYKKI